MAIVNEDMLSGNLAMWYRDIPITPEVLMNLEGTVTKECWKYLIGKMCIYEKSKRGDSERVQDVYDRIGIKFGYVCPSLKRLVNYANSIDYFHRILPDIASNILNGKMRLSLPDTIVLAKMDFHEICNVIERTSREKTPVSRIISEQKALRKKPERRGRPKRNLAEPPRSSVKDTPQYDPDAQVNGLTYTIPSWTRMVDRVSTNTNFYEVSSASRNNLITELKKIIVAADNMAARIVGEE